MAENNKKRAGSFRKLFPLFFSNKSKEKNKTKDSQSSLKIGTDSGVCNQYHNPRSMTRSDKHRQGDSDNIERIYENLTTTPRNQNDNMNNIDVSSNHSSSSTLVSDSVKRKIISNDTIKAVNVDYKHLEARPQVPPKPYNEMITSQNRGRIIDNQPPPTVYPDVYYHSLEKLTDKISPLDEMEIYKASHPPGNPASVGAEIKRVSTTFLISPKKEAEVRTIQPTRARSLSFDKNKERNVGTSKSDNLERNRNNLNKPYNYSAPTSPMPVNHRIPSIPKTVSPYEQIRKTMAEAEEKRNSLGLNNIRNKTSQSHIEPLNRSKSPVELDKEKTRQRVEAFYWQKLKELKQKEDEYFLRQSLRSSTRHNTSYSVSNCSTPNSLVLEPRSSSLPRGKDLQSYVNQPIYSHMPFIRNAPERRTDTFINTRPYELGIVYRNPEKANPAPFTDRKLPIFQRGSLRNVTRETNQQSKRVSFEEQLARTIDGKSIKENVEPVFGQKLRVEATRHPPRPPVRTTSVGTGDSASSRVIKNYNYKVNSPGGPSLCSESESGSEAGEIQRILQNHGHREEDWHGDGARADGSDSDATACRVPIRTRSSRRDDPRRHTLAGNDVITSQPTRMSVDIEHLDRQPRSMNAPEYATVTKTRNMEQVRAFESRIRKPPLPAGYDMRPPQNALLFDEDPGIMSEVETSSTGFRRGGKQRLSLPVVRTPSKTLERPLGLVFLQYRNETKRALLPNEITSIDTVKALFVRSFRTQLTMAFMDSQLVKIYIHDLSNSMFYELEDDRAHLRDIRDRTVLRLIESNDIGGVAFPGAMGAGSVAMPANATPCAGPSTWDQDPSYFSEPEIDTDYHVHKPKAKPAPAYYMGAQAPSTLPRGGNAMRAFSPAAPPVPADRVKTQPGAGHAPEVYMSSPERGSVRVPYEDPYYTQYTSSSSSRTPITPIIDEEASMMIEEPYQLYGVNAGMPAAPRPMPRPQYDTRLAQPEEFQLLRVENMERQLANLTGLVHQALHVPGASAPPVVAPRHDFQARTGPDAARYACNERPPKLGRDKFQKSVSFEKSVSFSDDPPETNKQHSPQHSADTKPTKPAIKSSTLPRTSSQERDRMKPAPPPKPAGLVGQPLSVIPQRTYTITVPADFTGQLRDLQKQSRDLRLETRNLRRSTLTQAIQMRQLIAETITNIGALAASFSELDPNSQLTREEEIYRQDMLLLENDLYELEATVERLRGQAANRETRVNMADIERIAMVLSKSSKTVADWKLKFPILQETMKIKLANEMEKVVRKEKNLGEEPERLELALRRCKKLTGTLVTLKRLACVQEQRLPMTDGRISPGSSQSSTAMAGPLELSDLGSDASCLEPQINNKGNGVASGRAAGNAAADLRPENALDALLDELQTFTRPPDRGGRGEGSLRRLHSYPSGSDTDASPPVRARGQHPPKPPVPERHPELLALAARRAPPPPPPRTTSRSPLASPPSPASPGSPPRPDPTCDSADDSSNSRQSLLEQRHQELLKKQRALQEQYARLQMIQRSGPALPQSAQPDLKKTGSESNLLSKMKLNLATAHISGSMTHLAGDCERAPPDRSMFTPAKPSDNLATTNKVYETDIL